MFFVTLNVIVGCGRSDNEWSAITVQYPTNVLALGCVFGYIVCFVFMFAAHARVTR